MSLEEFPSPARQRSNPHGEASRFRWPAMLAGAMGLLLAASGCALGLLLEVADWIVVTIEVAGLSLAISGRVATRSRLTFLLEALTGAAFVVGLLIVLID